MISAILLLIISTCSYYVPYSIVNIRGFDLKSLPEDFFYYYCWFTSTTLFLVSVYAFYLFVYTSAKYYKVKLLFLYLFLAEFYTFLNYARNKFFEKEGQDFIEGIITLLVFSVCFSWFISRALKNGKTAEFKPDQSYLIKFRPKNVLGVFNHLLNIRGHAGIYQDGKLYKFKSKTGKLSLINIKPEWIEKKIETGEILLEKITKIAYINSLVGQKFRLFRFNCNTLARHARKAN